MKYELPGRDDSMTQMDKVFGISPKVGVSSAPRVETFCHKNV